MVYESDFYTTRRPYRQSPSISSYTISGMPSRQVRVLPGLGKVHVTYSYDRVAPYVGHKRLTVVTTPPKVFATRPSILQREFDRIENKMRPWNAYSATNRYLNSDSAVRYYYLSYPTNGYTSSYSLNLPSASHYSPKVYRWYYSWPREYYSYWPYYRSYLTSYLKNFYLSSSWPSSYYWSSYKPYYRSLDYYFNDIENKIDNLSETRGSKSKNDINLYHSLNFTDEVKLLGSFLPPNLSVSTTQIINMLTYLRNPISGYEYSFWPDAKFFYHYKIYRPLSFHSDWPITAREWYPEYWPSYHSYWHYLRDVPSEESFRQLRVKNNLYWSDTRVC